MSFQVDRGLFKFDMTDHHAVLGVPLDAEIKEIRKRYLTIAQRLHPDTCAAENDEEKKLANQLLSKMVNPAYEQLSNKRNRAEHLVMLGQMGKRLTQEQPSVQLQGELSKKLAKAGANLDPTYKAALKSLAGKQYESIDRVLDMIAQASELNLIYVLRKGGQTQKTRKSSSASTSSKTSGAAAPKSTTSQAGSGADTKSDAKSQPDEDSTSSYVLQYCRRAEQLIEKNNFAKAILELRDGLKIEPNNSRCHSLMGTVYLKQNQTTMAKVHFDKALKADPNNEEALKGKMILDKRAQKAGGKTAATSKTNQGKSGKSSSGFLGGLFGGKKK